MGLGEESGSAEAPNGHPSHESLSQRPFAGLLAWVLTPRRSSRIGSTPKMGQERSDATKRSLIRKDVLQNKVGWRPLLSWRCERVRLAVDHRGSSRWKAFCRLWVVKEIRGPSSFQSSHHFSPKTNEICFLPIWKKTLIFQRPHQTEFHVIRVEGKVESR